MMKQNRIILTLEGYCGRPMRRSRSANRGSQFLRHFVRKQDALPARRSCF